MTYFSFDDGWKVVAPTRPSSNYLGLAELPIRSRVELDFQATRTGKLNLKGVTPLYILVQHAGQEMVMD